MEEQVGQLWHRLISAAAADNYPQAAVTLEQVRATAGVLFRALGGDPALRVENATGVEHGARRRWLQRLAGSQRRVELVWRDDATLRLPSALAVYPSASLNRDLYLWQTALAAAWADPTLQRGAPLDVWFVSSQRHARQTLRHWPGLGARYRRLVDAELARRALAAADGAVERAIRAALLDPGAVEHLPAAKRPPQPVLLWPHPAPPQPLDRTAKSTDRDQTDRPTAKRAAPVAKRRRGERVDEPEQRSGLLAFRLESLFSWTEYVNVDRTGDDDEDDDAARRADDLAVISVSRGGRSLASRLRFDLDLPAAAEDDLPLGDGVSLPEWDYRRQRLLADHCRLQPLVAPAVTGPAAGAALPARLRPAARRLRRQFQALKPARVWLRGQSDGCDVDTDAWIRLSGDRRDGRRAGSARLYRDFRSCERDLSCLLLADLSLSTDTWINNNGRVIDAIRDSLYLFSEALSAGGDRFALYGFSSRRRAQVRFHQLKTFAERYDDAVRARIGAIKPGYYTRIGAALRYAALLLGRQRSGQRLLLLLTDGKPNDLDCYEGRYGVEDTRRAVLEARRAGLQPFCVTIDQQGECYLPYLFGSRGYIVIRDPAELPRRLPLLYARLTGH